MSLFSRRIIFYGDSNWLYLMRNKIIEEDKGNISYYSKDELRYPDGTVVQFKVPCDSCRGLRYDLAYIQKGVDVNKLEEIILPKCLSGGSSYILDDINNMIYAEPAQDYLKRIYLLDKLKDCRCNERLEEILNDYKA